MDLQKGAKQAPNRFSHLSATSGGSDRELLPHIISGIRHTLELPFADVFIPMGIAFDHLLEKAPISD